MGSPSKEKGKRRLLGFVFSFGYEKGAACLPCLGRWCLVTMRPPGKTAVKTLLALGGYG